eukprot:2431516-Rhodomonas_salina.1
MSTSALTRAGERGRVLPQGEAGGAGGLEHVILLDYDPDSVQSAAGATALRLKSRALKSVQTARELNVPRAAAAKTGEIAYEQVPVDHPVYTVRAALPPFMAVTLPFMQAVLLFMDGLLTFAAAG